MPHDHRIHTLSFLLVAAFSASCQGVIGEPYPGAFENPDPTDLPDGSTVTGPLVPVSNDGGTPMGDGGGTPVARRCEPSPRRIWKLTPEQYTRSAQALVPGVGDLTTPLRNTVSLEGRTFTNEAEHLEMAPPHVEQLLTAAGTVSDIAFEHRAELSACLGASPPTAACTSGFVTTFAERAFRRPLRDEERTRFVMFHQAQASRYGWQTALRQVVRAVLMSPQFLYRSELGSATTDTTTGTAVELTAHERATALAYFLYDGPPDAELLRAAADDELGTGEQIAGQARRMLGRPEAARGVLRFFDELLHTSDVLDAEKFTQVYPTTVFNDTIARDMVRETEAFVQHVLWQDDGRLETLLTANWSVLNGRLATLYGLPSGTAGTTFSRVDLPAGQRAGLLTQGSFLTVYARPDESDPIHRGRFIRERLLCQPLPPPPPDLELVPPPPDGVTTQRQRLAEHSANATCAGCHRLMDPLGFGLEHYDGVGRYRTTEVGQPVDARGELAQTATNGSFRNGVELAALLARAPEVSSCFVQQLYRYAQGRTPVSLDLCTLETLVDRFARNGGNVRDLVVEIVTAPSFLTRTR